MTAKTAVAVTFGTATNCHDVATEKPQQTLSAANHCHLAATTATTTVAIGVGSMAATPTRKSLKQQARDEQRARVRDVRAALKAMLTP